MPYSQKVRTVSSFQRGGGPVPFLGEALILETTAKEVTMIVDLSGGDVPAVLQVDLEAAHETPNGWGWVVLASLTGPGVVTVDAHWVRYVRAALRQLSSGNSYMVSASIGVGNVSA